MAYEGDELNFCPPTMFDFRRASAVIVSGDGINKWGHMLLNTGGVGGNYFQIAGVRVRPRYMNEDGYQRYLRDTGKTEKWRIRVFIPRPEASQLRLEQLLNESWSWGVVVHNCETMVEQIIMAGGGQRIHQGAISLPTKAGWSLWSCGALKCPSHDGKKHICPQKVSPVWLCSRKMPGCPGHRHYDDSCGSSTGVAWSCGELSCPTHKNKSDCCPERPGKMWKCKRVLPPCVAHRSRGDQCSEAGRVEV